MSLAENLLNSLDETAYANTRIAGGGVEEEHIVVDASRTITVPANLKTIAVKGDKDIETVTIDCIRYWDGHDLSRFAVYINYILPNGSESTYIPENLTVFEDMFSFTWTIGREITSYQGGITFWIVAKLTGESGDLIKQWSSFQNSEFTVAQGGDKIYVPETQTEKDVISQVLAVSTNAAQRAEEAAEIAKTISDSALIDLQQVQHGEGDGDINIWRATFADGSVSDLVVKNGLTPFIGSNGNWWIGDRDTGIGASGGGTGTAGKDGKTPMLDLENGILSVSYDDGGSWTELGNVKGDKGDKGDPYTLTESDKAAIVSDVINALPTWNGGSY